MPAGWEAAVLRAKLPFLSGWNALRRANAASYRTLFEGAGLTDRVTLPPEPHAASGLPDHHIFHQYVLRIPGEGRRDAVASGLSGRGIGTAIYYPVPLHLQECFAYLGYGPGAFPEAEKAARESLALPIFPGLTRGEQEEIVGAIGEFLA